MTVLTARPATEAGPGSRALPAPSNEALTVDTERLVYRQTGAGLIGHFLGMVVVALVYWKVAPPWALRGWIVAFLLLWSTRFITLLAHDRAVMQGRDDPARWLERWNAGALAGAMLWSIGAMLLYDHGGWFQRTTLMLTIYSFAIGAVPYMASQPRLFLSCMGLYFVPMIVRTALHGGPDDVHLAGVWCLMALCTLVVGRGFHNVFGDMVSLRLHSEDLARRLKGEMALAEAAHLAWRLG